MTIENSNPFKKEEIIKNEEIIETNEKNTKEN